MGNNDQMVVRIGILATALCLAGFVADRAVAQSNSSADAERIRDWAKRLIDRYDKNGNKMLEKDERATLRGKPAGADLNGDDVITLNELVTHLSSDATAPARPQTPKPTKTEPAKPEPAATASVASSSAATQAKLPEQPARRRRESRESRATTTTDHKPESASPEQRIRTATDEGKSYRFKSPVERLPSGLPGWFQSRDANHDGQVAMSEYSHAWTDRTAEEFVRLDLNNDGFITPQECLRGR